MRVLFVSHSFPPVGRPLTNLGGMQRVAVDLHAALQVHPDIELYDHLLRTSWTLTTVRTPPFLLGLLRRLPRLVERLDIDVVLFSSMVTASVAPRLRKTLGGAGATLITICHGQDVVLPVGPYQRWVPRVLAALDAAAPVSRATGEACLARGLDPEKLRVIPNGVWPDRFASTGDRSADLALLRPVAGDLPDDALLLCSVGRHVERKGFQWFVDQVMPNLPDGALYWLAGEGPTSEPVREAVERHGLGERVRLLGRISNEQLEALYRTADLFVMPNIPVSGDMEGFGVVLIEAGLCGTPAVAARLEGIRDVITEGENGHFVEPLDAHGFADVIARYHTDREALAALSAGVRAFTIGRFSWPAVADRFADLFRAVHAPEPRALPE